MARFPLSHLRILLLGNDSTLLWTRELVLKQAGYAVYSALASELSGKDIECDIVVLCSSIPVPAAQALAQSVKIDHPSTGIVRLSPSMSSHDKSFDVVCDPTRGPANLLAELKKMGDTMNSAKKVLSVSARDAS